MKPKETRKKSWWEILIRNPTWNRKAALRNPLERLKYQNVANTMQMRGWSAKMWQIPCTMQSDHAKMKQIPCKMTDSSSKLLQIQGKWYQETKQTNPKPEAKSAKTILHPSNYDHDHMRHHHDHDDHLGHYHHQHHHHHHHLHHHHHQ